MAAHAVARSDTYWFRKDRRIMYYVYDIIIMRACPSCAAFSDVCVVISGCCLQIAGDLRLIVMVLAAFLFLAAECGHGVPYGLLL